MSRTEEGDTSMLRRVKKYKNLVIAGSLLLLLCLVLYLVLLVWTIRVGSCWDQLNKQWIYLVEKNYCVVLNWCLKRCYVSFRYTFCELFSVNLFCEIFQRKRREALLILQDCKLWQTDVLFYDGLLLPDFVFKKDKMYVVFNNFLNFWSTDFNYKNLKP